MAGIGCIWCNRDAHGNYAEATTTKIRDVLHSPDLRPTEAIRGTGPRKESL
jgi:hypothetical protein